MSKRKRKKSVDIVSEQPTVLNVDEQKVDRTNLYLIIILVFAVTIRILYFIQNSAHNPLFDEPISDAGVYYNWASEIASGKFAPDGVFYMAPLYPYILAGIFILFGESITSVVVVQHVVGVINLFLIFLLCKTVFGKNVAITALIIAVLHAPLMFYESKFLLPTFTVFFYLLSLLLLFKQEAQKPNYPLTFITGLVMGIAVVHRPNILLFIPLVVVWFFIHHKPFAKQALIASVLLVIGVALPILPVTMHNYNASGEFILLTSNTGINFYYGANKDAAPTFTRRESISDSIEKEEEKSREIAEEAEGRELSLKEISAYWMKRGFAEITNDFPKWLSYEINKLYWIVNTYEIPNNYNLPFEKKHVKPLVLLIIPFGFISLFSLLGMVLASKKDSRIILLLFYLASLFAGLMIFTVVSRFRIPLTVVLVGFAAFGIVEFFRILKNRSVDINSSKAFLASTLILIILAFPTLVPYRKATNPSSTYYTLGILAYREKRYEEAIKYQELALKTYPIYTEAFNSMGSCYKEMGDLDKAIEMYGKASETNPKYAASRFNAGLIHMEKKDYQSAIILFREALSIDTKYIKAKMNLSFALFRYGKVTDAIEIMNELIQMDPTTALHHYNLGLMLSQSGKYNEAMKQFEITLELDSNYQAASDALEKIKSAKKETGQ